jgi:hypothetical protein
VLLSSFLHDIRHNDCDSNLDTYLAPEQYHFCNANLRSVSAGRDRLDLGI